MSRTKPREGGATSPIKKIISYKPNAGVFAVYDKSTKKRSEVDSVDIIIVDADRFSLSGYSAQYDAPFVTNLVYNTKKEPLTVGVIAGGKYKEVARGLYQVIKGDLEGANYTKNVVSLLKTEDGYELVDLQLVGQARSKFQDWVSANEKLAEDSVITLTASKLVYNYNKAKGELEEVPKDKQKRWRTTWLRTLEFDTTEASGAEIRGAIRADEGYQSYLEGVGDGSAEKPSKDVPKATPEQAFDGAEEEEDDDLPF